MSPSGVLVGLAVHLNQLRMRSLEMLCRRGFCVLRGGQSFKVLIADDFASFRKCVCAMLRGKPFRVVGQATDGLDAVHKARRCQADLLLLDIGLPKLNGIAAARRISAAASSSKVIFISVNDDRELVESALGNGAWIYSQVSDKRRAIACFDRGSPR